MLPELKTLFISMTPVMELRGSIPLAINIYGLSWLPAYLWSVLGSIIIATCLLLLIGKVSNYLSRHSYFFNRFFVWLFEMTRRKHNRKFEHWKEAALLILVAVPLPFTGVWTGSLVAFVFGVPPKKALLLITAGSFIAGGIVLLLTLGLVSIV